MVKDAAYREAEKKIEEARRTGATELDLSSTKWINPDDKGLTELPESLWELTQLQELDLSYNQLTTLPEDIGRLIALQTLDLSYNQLTSLPEAIGQLIELDSLLLAENQLTALPNSIEHLEFLQSLEMPVNCFEDIPNIIGKLTELRTFIYGRNNARTCIRVFPEWLRSLYYLKDLGIGYTNIKTIPAWLSELQNLEILQFPGNNITDLPSSLVQLNDLRIFDLKKNPLNPELAVAYKEGLPAVKAYLRAKEEGQIVLNEAKLILVGEGGVGKTSLLAALRGDSFIEDRPTTHGVEVNIESLVVGDPDNGTEITLNGWDFGGQNIYRHTHQLFFTAPAIYLAVWEPRRGPEQSRVAEWIKMIKHRAYDESRPDKRPRILVVASHGGPSERLDHIDEQALRDEFGDLIVGFHHVDSKPDENGICYQLDELKAAIGREAAAIPSVGRTVPLSWKKVLKALRKRSKKEAYISYKQFEKICNRHSVSNDLAAHYAVILNELGHLIYYRDDEALQNTVILNPEYLSKAVGFVLEDKATKEAHGLIEHTRLGAIWHNPDKPAEERYPEELHSVFLRLMEKFDLSYQVVMPQLEAPLTSLLAQLVPGLRPEGWQEDWQLNPGDAERTQVCRVLDAETGRAVEAEGLMYRLIVRLHRYSLGRSNYYDSRHWKTGMILDDGYNGRGFIEEIGGDVYVTVRAAYPERFLHHLCSEIQWLTEHFWKGLDARMYVPCPLETCKGLLELEEMMDFLRNEMPKVRCAVCKEFHEIDSLMATMQPKPQYQDAVDKLNLGQQEILGALEQGFDAVDVQLDAQLRIIMSQADEQYQALLDTLADPAKDGPRLFSFEPVDRSRFNPKSWTRAKFRLTLWCEHRRLPLPALNEPGDSSGVYEIELTRDWVQKAAPVLKVISTTLSLALRIAVPGTKLATDDAAYKAIGEQLEFGVKTSDALVKGGEEVGDWLVVDENSDLNHSRQAIRARGSVLRELHALLREVDPANGFGGLERVRNKRREFLWVHKQYVGEY